MNEEQYRSLCEACDRLLLAPDSTIERVAIPWLHVIREHPVFLANYVDLFEPTKGGKAIVRKWLRVFRRRAWWFRQILRSLQADGRQWFGPDQLPRGIDALFVSHLLNSSQAGQSDDFYFGGLPNEMVAKGHSVVIALINHSGQSASHLADMWKESLVPRVILSGSLQFLEEVALRHRLKTESLRLRKLATREDHGLARCVIARASQEALSGGSLTALCMASQIGALVTKLWPKAIVVTHEGHSWERVAFAAARKSFPGVRCIGYQHAALFRLQHAVRRNLALGYNPDQILTAGTVGKAQMERAPGLNGIPISVLGSNRAFKGATINGGLPIHPDKVDQLDKPACLVLPEGIASECHFLFEFSMACAQSCPEIQFVWRLHPIVTYESLAVQNQKLRTLPRNIVLSQATLEEDIARCRWTLYRGTTAVVPAVVAGLRPIYLQLSGELTIDPLYELEVWRTKVASVSEFIQVIRSDVDACNGFTEADFDLARRYCESFFLPSDVGVLIT